MAFKKKRNENDGKRTNAGRPQKESDALPLLQSPPNLEKQNLPSCHSTSHVPPASKNVSETLDKTIHPSITHPPERNGTPCNLHPTQPVPKHTRTKGIVPMHSCTPDVYGVFPNKTRISRKDTNHGGTRRGAGRPRIDIKQPPQYPVAHYTPYNEKL